ncbi:DUF6777 domain-containing protein [Streptomyces sp. NBC_01750]|uniref:DUF6777 domain-containing protein n=1 Tax=Streptomyces sp. NBC_01750 TaxID=2975928 RepID=UPI002DD9364F|nr:DUF6777 domain-containing protein [Streptomyces sp. NBC_01750]WSD34413.1 primosomal protein [Streptomyces sp. NBC_01750]
MGVGTMVVGAAMAVILTVAIPGGKRGGGEVFLQTPSAAGPDPFTPSTVTQDKDTAASSASPGTSSAGADGGTGALVVDGSHPGLYGGTQNLASCDVEKQVKFLTENGDEGQAFAGALNLRQSEIPQYLRSLTPTRLVWDTRVTNHGYKSGAATSYQAILQAGTAVLVDDRGVPRVRCACGNPLTPPVAGESNQKYTGRQWSSFQPSNLVAVTPAEKPMKAVTMFDEERKGWFQRPSGDLLGKSDARVPAPKGQPAGTPFPVLPPPESTEEHQDKKEEEYPEKGKKKDEDSKKDQPKDHPKDEPKDEPKGQPKDQSKSEPKEQPKDEPKDHPKEQPKDEPKNEPKNEPKEQPKDEPKGQPKDQSKSEPKEQPKDEPKDQPKDQSKSEPKEQPKDEPKDHPKDHPQNEPKDEPKDEPKEQPKNEPKDQPKNEPKNEPKDHTKNEPKDQPNQN